MRRQTCVLSKTLFQIQVVWEGHTSCRYYIKKNMRFQPKKSIISTIISAQCDAPTTACTYCVEVRLHHWDEGYGARRVPTALQKECPLYTVGFANDFMTLTVSKGVPMSAIKSLGTLTSIGKILIDFSISECLRNTSNTSSAACPAPVSIRRSRCVRKCPFVS